jgi:ankyrin repeat protein
VQVGYEQGAQLLLGQGASINAANAHGETPLIMAVHNRDLPMAKTLLELGANPSQTDSIAGMSARDYAQRDPRAAAILRLMDLIKVAPPSRKIAGPPL